MRGLPRRLARRIRGLVHRCHGGRLRRPHQAPWRGGHRDHGKHGGQQLPSGLLLCEFHCHRTVAAMLAEALGCGFVEADDYHSQANKAKMSNGIPLTDDDRSYV